MALLLNPFAPALLGGCRALDALLSPPHFSAGATPGVVRVESSDAGRVYLASLPGLTPAEVTVELVHAPDREQGAELHIHALPQLQASLALAATADLSAVAASLVNGELRVVVPSKPRPEPVSIPVAAARPSAEAADGGDNDSAARTQALLVPGFGAALLSVTLDPATRRITVKGRRAAGDAQPAFRDTLRAPKMTRLNAITASAVDGVLELRFPVAAQAEANTNDELVVAAAAEGSSFEPQAGERVVAELPVPGMGAASLRVRIAAGAKNRRVLHVSSAQAEQDEDAAMAAVFRRRLAFRVELPKGVATIGVRCVAEHGLLRILAPQPKAAVTSEVALATDKAAELLSMRSSGKATVGDDVDGGAEEEMEEMMEEGEGWCRC